MSKDKNTESEKKAESTGLSWDGITELKNPSPRWWNLLFYAALIWGVFYLILYPIFPSVGGLLHMTERKELVKILSVQNPLLKNLQEVSLQSIQQDPELYTFARAYGETVFKENCAACHGLSAQGISHEYPSLVDDEWIWPKDIESMEQTVRYGIRSDHPNQRAALSMPSFDWMDAPIREQIVDYVLSLPDTPPAQATKLDGAQAYAENCATCHGDEGTGQLDYGVPSLRNHVWLFRQPTKDSMMSQLMVPKMGFMPAWEGRLKESELKAVVTYVYSLTSGE